MTIMIALPEPLTHLLEQKATQLHLSVDQLAAQLLSEALQDELIEFGENESIEKIVAGIKGLPHEPKYFQSMERAHQLEYINWLLANPPLDTATVEEWEHLWPQIEQEIEETDRIQKISKRRF
jgi:hypothetical protein